MNHCRFVPIKSGSSKIDRHPFRKRQVDFLEAYWVTAFECRRLFAIHTFENAFSY